MRRVALSFVAVIVAMLAFAAPSFAAAPTASTTAAASVATTTATVNATVNTNGNALDTLDASITTGGADSTGCYFEYGTTQGQETKYQSCSPTPSGSASTLVSAKLTGLTAGTQYWVQVVMIYDTLLPVLTATPVDGGQVTFTTNATGTNPKASTLAASNIFSTAATLNGSVNAGGATVKSCSFQYGTSATTLTQTATCSPTPSGSTDTAVAAGITGLTPSTTYYYDVTITTASGTATGSAVPFTTTTTAPPAPTGNSTPTAATINDTSATLSGSVNSGGAPVLSCTFNYGPTTTYGSQAACSPTPSGTSPQTVTASLTGLTSAATYHYQLVLKTAGGTFASSDESFATIQAVTQAAGNVTGTTAQLTGTVNPEGQTVSKCEFVYAVSPNGQPQTALCDQANISGSTSIPVTASLSGLSANTGYVYAVVLFTGNGEAVGGLQNFTTPAAPKGPTGSTGAATGVTSTSATLQATVDGNGAAATGCEFEYGVTPFSTTLTGSGSTYGLDVACQPSPGSGTTSVSVTLRGLAPDTTYYYRILFATNAGYVIGTTRSFHTPVGSGPGNTRPGAKITGAKIKHATAKFAFKATGPATKAQCSLAKVKNGRVQRHSFKACKSPASYTKLAHGNYRFYVRFGNSAGFGSSASRAFKI